MKKIISIVVAIFILLAVISVQGHRIDMLKEECAVSEQNTRLLLTEVDIWRTQDSLSMARTEALQLQLKQYEQYRAKDKALIEELRQKKEDLERVVDAQSRSIYELQATPKDTFLIIDSIPILAQSISIHDRWITLDGVVTSGSFVGTIETRDSLLVVETVQYGRFLWWKTGKVKHRSHSVVSRNPHTTIEGFEVIELIQ